AAHELAAHELAAHELAAHELAAHELAAHELDEVSAHGAVMAESSVAEGRVADRVVARAEGNPLFIEQLMTMLGDGGDPERLPLSVRALIAARVEAAAGPERAVLECAAVAGREFTLAHLRALDAPEENVAALVRGRFLDHLGDGRLRFASGLIQEVCYQAVSKRRLAGLHEKLAHWLAGRGDDDETIGRHLEQAYRHRTGLGRPGEHAVRLRDTAAARLSAAGISALHRGDLSRAAGLLERAADLYGPGDPLRLGAAERLGETRVMLGEVERGERLLREVLAEAETMTGEAAVVAAHARLFLGHLEPEPSVEVARDCLTVFRAAGDDLGLARARLRIGQAVQARGRFTEATETLQQALGHAVRAGAELERATALGALAVSLQLGPVPAGAAVGQCLDLLREHGQGRGTVAAAIGCPLAVLHAMRGDFTEARAAFRTAESTMTGIGHAYAEVFLPLFAAFLDLLDDRPEAAERALRRSCAAAELLGDGQLRTMAWRDLARARLDRGDPAGACGWIALALGSAPGALPINRAELLGMKARALCDDPARARALAAEAVRQALDTDSPACQGAVLLDQAHVLAAWADRGADREAARAAAEQAAERFAAKGHRVGAVRAGALLATLEAP
ncbi:hypothetical protein, partial [Planobispora takensis]